ncbi:hypothetical protein QBC46DRAFT_419797 [Diplogelasinospora grovesii]|uniref:Uncharacterized protein n=1 Tax=Diplogelasinospora grovesii TaxID=303347 RepID=A0AAN6NE82_9PEZI|nr:hypothetical protein QBC46DRAFT_419797 [Diplogelasinospora grovesii]
MSETQGIPWPDLPAQQGWFSHRSPSSSSVVSDELSDLHISRLNKTWHRPFSHLLIDASHAQNKQDRAGLCRVLLSAVVQGYPPPILINYRPDEKPEPLTPTVDALNATLRVLSGPGIHENDLILWLGGGSWLQVPAEITVRRWLQYRDVLDARLAQTYGSATDIHQRVLFPVTDCKHDRQKCVGSGGGFMGRTRDAIPLLQAALDLTTTPNTTTNTTSPDHRAELEPDTRVWDRLFEGQERSRNQLLTAQRSFFGRLRGLFYGTNNNTITGTGELGIGIDYESRIFQKIAPTTLPDIRFLTYNNRTMLVRPPARNAAKSLYDEPLTLPPELGGSILQGYGPFDPSSEDRLELDQELEEFGRVRWLDVGLVTNIAVPRGNIPAVLDTSQMGHEEVEEWWNKMWYSGRLGKFLLEQYVHPYRFRLAKRGGNKLGWDHGSVWNSMGGKGGLWTDQGGWVRWDHVCGGEYDDVLFGGPGPGPGPAEEGDYDWEDVEETDNDDTKGVEDGTIADEETQTIEGETVKEENRTAGETSTEG